MCIHSKRNKDMTWWNEDSDEKMMRVNVNESSTPTINTPKPNNTTTNVVQTIKCPSCGNNIQPKDQGGFNELPAGVKFDPNDNKILEHLQAKVMMVSTDDTNYNNMWKLHPLIDQFIPTLHGENGICYTHPENLPGVSKDGQIRHFFHRPSKAYTTGTRKRRRVDTDEEGSETRWHKTGKTRPIYANGVVKGFKKILVLYTNYCRQKKPKKTNWVMHQYHVGSNEEERDGEVVVSKVFYQTQPRQSGNSITRGDSYEQMINNGSEDGKNTLLMHKSLALVDYSYKYNGPYTNYDEHVDVGKNKESCSPQVIPNLVVQGEGK